MRHDTQRSTGVGTPELTPAYEGQPGTKTQGQAQQKAQQVGQRFAQQADAQRETAASGIESAADSCSVVAVVTARRSGPPAPAPFSGRAGSCFAVTGPRSLLHAQR